MTSGTSEPVKAVLKQSALCLKSEWYLLISHTQTSKWFVRYAEMPFVCQHIVDGDDDDGDDDRFYIALFSALEQTHCFCRM